MPSEIHVMGEYWLPHCDELTPLGRRMAAAKEGADVGALAELASDMAEWAAGLALPGGAAVVPVPSAPGRHPHPVGVLATAVAEARGARLLDALVRHNPTPRLREAPVDGREALVEAAGYEVARDVAGLAVVLVDDVVLTATTLTHVAALLRDAGATEVVAVAAARTRRG